MSVALITKDIISGCQRRLGQASWIDLGPAEGGGQINISRGSGGHEVECGMEWNEIVMYVLP